MAGNPRTKTRCELKLSRGANYSFHALVVLAGLPPAEVMSIEQLAEEVQASPSYMAKLLQRLARAGLVVAHRGRAGGYSLGRPGQSITLWEVVAALHGGDALRTPLLPICSRCPLSPVCPLRDTLQSAGDEMRRRLQEVTVGTLARLLEEHRGSGSPQEIPTSFRRS